MSTGRTWLLTFVVAASIALTSSVRLTVSPDSSKCLTKKMLISCYTNPAATLGVIHCGTVTAATTRIATEVLLEWDHNATRRFGMSRQAQLKIELSKPPDGLHLVLLDLSGEELCTAASSGTQLQISFPAYAGSSTRLAFRGLRLPTVSRAALMGNLVINSDLLDGVPSLEQLAVSGNNVSLTEEEPLAKYSVTRANQLRSFTLLASIHSASYSVPLLAHLPGLQSVRIGQSNMLLLRAGAMVGLTSLRYLYLNQNNIRRLEPGCFKGLISLQHLQININGLNRLENNAFSDLSSLQKLNLAGNHLSDIEPNAFHGLVQLTHLDLSDNKLASLSDSVFVQLHSLQMLSLASNDLSGWARNDTFCPLGSLQTLWTDAPPVDCVKFSAERLVQHVSVGSYRRPKKYECDIGRLAEEKRPCNRWLDRLMPNKSSKDARVRAATASGDGADRPSESQPTRLTIVLLIVFSIVCLIHVLTTGVTLYVCRRIRRQDGGGGGGGRGRAGKGGQRPWNGRRRAPSLTTPLEEEEDAGRSLKAAGSSDGVLVSFQSSGAASTAGASSTAAGNGSSAGKSAETSHFSNALVGENDT